MKSTYKNSISTLLKYKDIVDKYKLTFDGLYFNSNHSITCNTDLVKDGQLIIPFGKIDGNFYCCYMDLQNLINCPRQVKGFNCSFNKLTDLKNSPVKCLGNFICTDNLLTSLEGCPKRIYGAFNVIQNKLTSLKYCPKYIKTYFSCAHNMITDLTGCPEKLIDFFCNDNKLENLNNGPKVVIDRYFCFSNNVVFEKPSNIKCQFFRST